MSMDPLNWIILNKFRSSPYLILSFPGSLTLPDSNHVSGSLTLPVSYHVPGPLTLSDFNQVSSLFLILTKFSGSPCLIMIFQYILSRSLPSALPSNPLSIQTILDIPPFYSAFSYCSLIHLTAEFVPAGSYRSRSISVWIYYLQQYEFPSSLHRKAQYYNLPIWSFSSIKLVFGCVMNGNRSYDQWEQVTWSIGTCHMITQSYCYFMLDVR